MFLFKREPVDSKHNLEELKNFVAQTVETMLMTREETINISEKFDLVLIFSWDNGYIEGAIYHWSTFDISKGRTIASQNLPLYIETRLLNTSEDTVVYIDDERIKNLPLNIQQIFYAICELVRIFDVEVSSKNKYKCIW